MRATIEHVGADVLCRSEHTTPAECRLDGRNTAQATLEAWAIQYDDAVRTHDDEHLFMIGREMFKALDGTGWASAWAKATGPRELEVCVDDLSAPLAQALLDAPWELLASQHGFLADDVQLFELTRRVGKAAAPIEPRFSDLQLMFMAAAPEGIHPLDFEAEESAILGATKNLPIHLVVEESGAAQSLGERLNLDGPFEALHLSCHGDIDPQRGHVLVLENEVGEIAFADASDIATLIGDHARAIGGCESAGAAVGRDVRG